MKRTAIIGLIALGLVAASPARANFSLIRFADGRCEIWLDTFAPRGTGWTMIAITQDWWSAQVARDFAIVNKVCIL